MATAFKVNVDADSALAHRLAHVLDRMGEKDKGVIPDKDSATWYEHLVSADDDGEVNAEAFVLVIVPANRRDEGQEKWQGISESVQDLLSTGGKVNPLREGKSHKQQHP